MRTLWGWIVQGAVKTVSGAALGSAAVAAGARWVMLSYLSLSGPALTALWLAVAFFAYVGLVHLFSRFPKLLGGSTQAAIFGPGNWSPGYRQPLAVVHHKTFENQEVPLDGMKYDHCRFKNVTFKIEGQSSLSLGAPGDVWPN